jgi:hypothetical protein
MKTGEVGHLVIEGKRLFARKLPHEASGYDIGADRSVYSIPFTISVHETSLRREARRDTLGLPIQPRGKHYRIRLYLDGINETLWLTRSLGGHIAAFGELDAMQSWEIVSIGRNDSSKVSSWDQFMLLDDIGSSYIYLTENGVLSTEVSPLEHPRWTKGFLFQLTPLNDSTHASTPATPKRNKSMNEMENSSALPSLSDNYSSLDNNRTSHQTIAYSIGALLALMLIIYLWRREQ